jgi:HEAT repeat protein
VTRYHNETTVFANPGQPRRSLAAASSDASVEPKTAVSVLGERLRQSSLSLLDLAPIESNDARRELVAILANLNTSAAQNRLASFTTDVDAYTRTAACIALLEDGDPRGAEGLFSAIGRFEWKQRQEMADALGLSGFSAALPVLLRLLKDNDYDVRRSAANALGHLRQPEAIPDLTDTAAQDSNDGVRAYAALALAKLGEPIDEDTAANYLQAPPTAGFQLRGASALMRLGNRAGRGALRRMVEQSSPPFPELAATMLVDGEGWKDLDLVQWLVKSSNDKVRLVGVMALCRSSEDAAFATLMDRLNSDNPEIRNTIAAWLSICPNPAAQQALLEVVENNESAPRRSEALASLARRGKPLPFGTIFAWTVVYHQPEVRKAGAQWLASCHDSPEVVDLLLNLAEDEGSDISANALVSLSEFDDARVFPVLISKLQSKSWQQRLGAILGIEVMGKQAEDLLVDRIDTVQERAELSPLIILLSRMEGSPRTRRVILDHALVDPAVWIKTAEQAASAGDQSVIPSVAAGLSSPDARIRQSAAITLGAIGDDTTVAPLLEALSDLNWEVRVRAAQSLENVTAHNPELLHQGLRVRKPGVRARVAELLGRVHDSGSSEALIEAMSDANRLVRANAAGALGMIGDARSVSTLIQGLKDPDRGVRNMAAGALKEIGGAEALAAVRDWTLDRRASAEAQTN